jgi:hypothetical protein
MSGALRRALAIRKIGRARSLTAMMRSMCPQTVSYLCNDCGCRTSNLD